MIAPGWGVPARPEGPPDRAALRTSRGTSQPASRSTSAYFSFGVARVRSAITNAYNAHRGTGGASASRFFSRSNHCRRSVRGDTRVRMAGGSTGGSTSTPITTGCGTSPPVTSPVTDASTRCGLTSTRTVGGTSRPTPRRRSSASGSISRTASAPCTRDSANCGRTAPSHTTVTVPVRDPVQKLVLLLAEITRSVA